MTTEDSKDVEQESNSSSMDLDLVIRYLGVVLVDRKLTPGNYVIGRGKQCDIKLTQDFISRCHGRIVFEDGSWFYEDLRKEHPKYSKDRKK